MGNQCCSNAASNENEVQTSKPDGLEHIDFNFTKEKLRKVIKIQSLWRGIKARERVRDIKYQFMHGGGPGMGDRMWSSAPDYDNVNVQVRTLV